MLLFFNGSALQLNNAFDILSAFGERSRCKVNMNKSNAFYVKYSKGNMSQPFSVNSLSWPQNLVTCLVVNAIINNFDNNLLFSENFPSITREVQTLFNIWSSRGLTLLGELQYEKVWLFLKLCIKPFIYQ